MTFIEQNIEFDFKTAVVQHVQDSELGHGLKNVDFIVRENNETILIEAKETSSHPKDFLSDAQIIQFVEKARDTYTYLHLMQETNGDLTYIIVIDFTRLNEIIESAFLNKRHDSLKAFLKGEKGHRWKQTYINRALLLPLKDFFYNNYTAIRIP